MIRTDRIACQWKLNLLIEKFVIEETEENLDRTQQFILEDDFAKLKENLDLILLITQQVLRRLEKS